jgi:hypothetical protein
MIDCTFHLKFHVVQLIKFQPFDQNYLDRLTFYAVSEQFSYIFFNFIIEPSLVEKSTSPNSEDRPGDSNMKMLTEKCSFSDMIS